MAAAVLATSFLSGIFGMAGGMILLGVLLLILDVAPAMVLFGVTQFASNGWRAVLWRRHIQWGITAQYALGSVATFGLMKLVAFVPDKATLYIGLGMMPFLVDRLPPSLQPDITRRFAPFLCGCVIMVLQLLAGAAGNVLDVFFQQSQLDRKTIVATKAATQALAHVLRVLYFGSFAVTLHETLPLWVFALAIAVAFTGTSLAAMVLHRMSEANFRRWSKLLIRTVSASYVLYGAWLLAR
nr:TSUP family transporter [Alsobacter ponti]